MVRYVVSTLRVCALISCIGFSADIQSAILLSGNASSTTQSFTFGMQAHGSSAEGGTMYIAADPGAAGSSGTYALSFIKREATRFEPLAIESVLLNGVQGTNPIFNKGIKLFTVIPIAGSGDNLAMVTSDVSQAANVYAYESFFSRTTIRVLSAENIKDATGTLVTAGIAGLTSYATTLGTFPSVTSRAGVVAAAINNGGTLFGAVGSGIALLQLQDEKVTVDENKTKTQRLFKQIDDEPTGAPVGDQTRSSQFDITSSFIKIGNDVVSLVDSDNIVAMCWNNNLQRLYVALKVTGNSGVSDGARAIAVGYFTGQAKLQFVPFAPNTVFTQGNNDEIIGGIAANAQISIHTIRSLRTSTALDYLIVVGGNGAPDDVANQVYALPLTNEMDDMYQVPSDLVPLQGVLADKNAEPVAVFSGSHNNNSSFFKFRAVREPATTPADIYTNDDTDSANAPAIVGRGPLPAGVINDITIARDTIFVTASLDVDLEEGPNQLPGIFYSTVLFNTNGTIKGWTPWQRVAGMIVNVFGMSYDLLNGTFNFMTGVDVTTINTIERTQWGLGDPTELQQLVALLSQEFPQGNGGLQGLYDFQAGTDQVTATPGLFDISVLAATGLNKVMLVQTGSTVMDTFIPSSGTFVDNRKTFTNGTITSAVDAPVLIMSGGALANVGSIIAADIGVSGTQGWFFVGGVGGLAVLMNSDGSGWDTTSQLTTNFAGLAVGMRWKNIGDYAFVRKIVYDGGFLYVLTDTGLDRINLALSNFQTGELSVAHVATREIPQLTDNGAFLDMLITEKLALLATSAGLYRVGNGASIRTAQNPDDVNWTLVPLNDGIIPIGQLIPMSPTGLAQQLGNNEGGNVWAINAYIGYNQGQVNRLVIAGDIATTPISDTTVTAVPDIVVENNPGTFITTYEYFNVFATDGSLYLYGQSQNLLQELFFRSIMSRQRANRNVPIDLNSAGVSALRSVIRSSASGSWLIGGDLVRVNE